MQGTQPEPTPIDAAATPAEGPAPVVSTVPAAGLARTIGVGFSWLTLSLVAGKAFGAIAQLALGRWISEDQFRDFAIVAAVAAVTKVFNDGGVPQVLVQRGSAEFNRLIGPAFWLSATFGLAAGLLLAVAAPIVAWIYGSSVLLPALLIVALTLPLGAPASVLRAKLRVDLRFQAVAVIAVFWFMIRHFSAIGFAAVGLGVVGLVLPLLLVGAFEAVAAYYATRIRPWLEPPQFDQWPKLLANSTWVVLTASFRGLSRTGDYLVLGLLVPPAVLGRYFFGYQFTTQIVELLATNLQHVLFPALSRLADEPERQSRAILRTIRLLVLVAAPVSLGLAVTVRPIVEVLDLVIWKNKWSAAIPLMQIFAVAAPVRMFSDVVTASLASRGNFRHSAWVTVAEGLWLMTSAAVAVAIGGTDLATLALVIALSQVTFSVVSSMWLLRGFGISPVEFARSFLPPWAASLAAAGVAVAGLQLAPSSMGPGAAFVLAGTVFTAAFVLTARVLLLPALEELARVMPPRMARLLRRALLLPGPAAA